jgi:glucose-6-phosphate 1-dehydrogenase
MTTYLAVFGATGNLMYKKLLPAFANLQKHGLLPADTKILCVARSEHTLESYLTVAKEQVKEAIDWANLETILEYFQMDFFAKDSYDRLHNKMETDARPLRLFYLAVAPELFPVVARGISESKLIEKNDPTGRIVFEKPFGEDLPSAKAINQLLWQYFDESQIYRVDHYLGKEMIQNILVMRFANRLFENNWNRLAIERVTIVAKETEGVMNRGNYYDHVGALKDMIQSHLMQMAALVAMEVPQSFDVDGIRAEKVNVLKHFRFEPRYVVTGQYEGYLKEKNIAPDSTTETFVFLKARIDTPRWRGVPFYFLTGKKLNQKRSEIIVDFRDNSQQKALWPDQPIVKNQLVIGVSPDEGVTFRLNVKEPGLSSNIIAKELDYCHHCQYVGNRPEAYERIVLDLIKGNSTLFTRWDEIETAWEIVDEIKKHPKKPIVYRSFETLQTAVNGLVQEDLI